MAIVLGSVFCIVLLSILGNLAGSGGSSSAPPVDSEPSYKVSMPRTLVDGKYRLSQDMSEEAAAENPDLGPDDQHYMGVYNGSSAKEQIVYTGLNSDATGRSSITKSDDRALDGMERDPSIDVAVPRRRITPSGGGEPVTCEVMTKSEGGKKLSVPTCAWSNRGSVGMVADNGYEVVLSDPEDVDLDAFADEVDKVRDEVRSSAG